jgi:hypothetical protein
MTTTNLKGVISLSSFSGQHDAIGSIENGVGNVGGLSAGRPRLLDHRLQHLGGANHTLAGLVALGYDLLKVNLNCKMVHRNTLVSQIIKSNAVTEESQKKS